MNYDVALLIVILLAIAIYILAIKPRSKKPSVSLAIMTISGLCLIGQMMLLVIYQNHGEFDEILANITAFIWAISFIFHTILG